MSSLKSQLLKVANKIKTSKFNATEYGGKNGGLSRMFFRHKSPLSFASDAISFLLV